ncbi:MAG TPA: hypothetical protein VGE54_06895 [Brevundimonas sp.]
MDEQATDTSRRSVRRLGGRAGAVALSVAAHLVLLPAILLATTPLPDPPADDPAPIIVSLIQPPKPPPPAPEPAPVDDPVPAKASTSPSPSSPAPPRPDPQPPRPRPARVTPPANVPSVPASPAPSTGEAFVTVGEGQLAGATRAGSGSGSGSGSGDGGGSCDMVRRLQDALRADPDIRAAVSAAQGQVGSGRALLLWNGSWVRSPGQSGNGLAGVRQAIAVEVAFAPEVCRERAMRGLVLLTFADGARIALGGGQWRWGDLLKGR